MKHYGLCPVLIWIWACRRVLGTLSAAGRIQYMTCLHPPQIPKQLLLGLGTKKIKKLARCPGCHSQCQGLFVVMIYTAEYLLVSISVNFPISVNRNSCFLSPFELKNGSKNEILVNVNLPLFSVSFCTLCNKKLACPRNIPKHSSRNDLCSLCSFPMREKLHRQFFFGQTDQKLQRLFWTSFLNRISVYSNT